MMRDVKLVVLPLALFLGSCNLRPLYAPLGAAVGGGAGSLAGPAGAFVGAGAGAATGALLAGDQELQQAKDTITALSEGDVQALVEAGLGKQKGFIEEALDTVYDFMKLCLVGIILWQFLPLAYTYFVHKKTKQNGNPEKT